MKYWVMLNFIVRNFKLLIALSFKQRIEKTVRGTAGP